MSVIACRAITKDYHVKRALKNIDLDIEENTITGLIGRNGAGKSTLLKIIMGFIRQTSGEVRVFNNNPFNSLTVSANTIFLDDHTVFPLSMNLEEILQQCETFYANWDSTLASGLFQYFSFSPYAHYQQLSKGMKSTFNMIVGLAARCPLTIFDEPTTGMDRAVRQDFYRALLKDYINHPRTIILSSHLLNEMESLLENIVLMKDGEVLLHKSISELKEYAIGMEGPSHKLKKWTPGRKVLHEKQVSPHQSYIVLENNLSTSEIEEAQKQGIYSSPVTLEDLCVYMTSEMRGGIDDVFNRSEPK